MKSILDVDEKIFARLYADDTIILTESENNMQKALMLHVNIAEISIFE